MKKYLGKIENAYFGHDSDRTFLVGLYVALSFNGYGAMQTRSVNILPECKWTPEERSKAIAEMVEYIQDLLEKAKVNCVSDLKGKPIEVTCEGNTVQSFRILTEVL